VNKLVKRYISLHFYILYQA